MRQRYEGARSGYRERREGVVVDALAGGERIPLEECHLREPRSLDTHTSTTSLECPLSVALTSANPV